MDPEHLCAHLPLSLSVPWPIETTHGHTSDGEALWEPEAPSRTPFWPQSEKTATTGGVKEIGFVLSADIALLNYRTIILLSGAQLK